MTNAPCELRLISVTAVGQKVHTCVPSAGMLTREEWKCFEARCRTGPKRRQRARSSGELDPRRPGPKSDEFVRVLDPSTAPCDHLLRPQLRPQKTIRNSCNEETLERHCRHPLNHGISSFPLPYEPDHCMDHCTRSSQCSHSIRAWISFQHCSSPTSHFYTDKPAPSISLFTLCY